MFAKFIKILFCGQSKLWNVEKKRPKVNMCKCLEKITLLESYRLEKEEPNYHQRFRVLIIRHC